MPVPSLARTPDHVAGADFRLWTTFALGPANAEGDDQGLAERVGMPVGSGAGLEADDRASGASRPLSLEGAVDADGAK